jgi:hypothetical protein
MLPQNLITANKQNSGASERAGLPAPVLPRKRVDGERTRIKSMRNWDPLKSHKDTRSSHATSGTAHQQMELQGPNLIKVLRRKSSLTAGLSVQESMPSCSMLPSCSAPWAAPRRWPSSRPVSLVGSPLSLPDGQASFNFSFPRLLMAF